MQQHHSPSLKQDQWAQAEKTQNEEKNTEISPKILRARHVECYVPVHGGKQKRWLPSQELERPNVAVSAEQEWEDKKNTSAK